MKPQGILIALLLTVFFSCKSVKDKKAKDSLANTQTVDGKTTYNEEASSENTPKTGNVLAANRGTTGADLNLADQTSSSTRDQHTNENIEGTSITSGNIVNQSSGSTGAASNAMMNAASNIDTETTNFEKMYTDLKMTEAQIQQFRTAMRNYKPTEGRDLEDDQDKKLESILSESQYEAYVKWKKNH
ncbi:hypothetical protein [uncultured Kriegella sp.]|uniref:hypothetical protein n=1 Tax=uncultured Kriegella sp. TaxID=1798910 RepID=UPI0030D9F17B|tara:strand:- start:111957 stop:112517 length:561 start_codon:yes stop_codon:yes gene_type:complete